MLALNITDLKDFTNKLFIGNVFDHFWLNEASITTFNTFTIEGKLQSAFFDSDEQDSLNQSQRTCALWKEVKPYCYFVIRGKRLPLHFKIILQLPPAEIQKLFSNSVPSFANIGNLYLNLQYRNQSLLCTTGVSCNTFIPGVQPGTLWDDQVIQFLQKNDISFEEISL